MAALPSFMKVPSIINDIYQAMTVTLLPRPALKNKRELISRGRKANGGIINRKNGKSFSVSIRPLKWKESLWIKTEDRQAARYLADAAFYYSGRPPVHFREADIRFPPLRLNTGEYLTTREECAAYVTKIAKGSALLFKRREYKERVQRLVLDAVKSPEAVQFLKSGYVVRKIFELESLEDLDLEEEHWNPFEAARFWRSEKKKALPTEYHQFLLPSFKAGFTIHEVEATHMMPVQDLWTHVQPEQAEEASFDSSVPQARSFGEGQTPKIKQHVKHPAVADLPSSADCLEESGDEPDSESEAMDIPTDEEVLSGESGASLESHAEIATADSHGPRLAPSRMRSAASAFDEDNLFAKIRPFVNQQIEEALLPLISALRSREEDEHKHRQKMLALEQEKLALMRQKLEKLALMRQKLECTRRSNAVPASVAK